MQKKMGVNSKAEAVRAWKSATKSERKERDVLEKEEMYWREAEGAKSRATKKHEEEAEKRAEPRLANWLRWSRRRSRRLTKN